MYSENKHRQHVSCFCCSAIIVCIFNVVERLNVTVYRANGSFSRKKRIIEIAKHKNTSNSLRSTQTHNAGF